jgi:RNA polymerase sigma-70 factor (ECF subfamily)
MDDSVIERSQRGDTVAFAVLFERYKDLVYKTASLILDSRQEAEDVQQDVFVQVYRHLHRYDPTKAAFTTWLYKITVNQCLTQRRRHRLLHRLGLDRTDPLPPVPSPEAQLGNEAVRRGLRGLSYKLRVILVLRYYHQFSYGEIQEILAIPMGTVKSRIHQALRELRRALAPEFPELQHPSPQREVKP